MAHKFLSAHVLVVSEDGHRRRDMAASTIQGAPEESWEKYAVELLHERLAKLMSASSEPIRDHYEETLLPEFKRRYIEEIKNYDRRNSLAIWLGDFIKNFLAAKLGNVVKGRQVIDEELVRLANAGFELALAELMARYSQIIDKTVSAIVWKNHKCPPSQDQRTFVEDVASEVKLQVVRNFPTYQFESSFKSWVHSICENESENARRKIQGQGHVERHYVSLEELLQEPYAFVIRNEEHVDILHKIFEIHVGQGERARKSLNALYLRFFDGYDSEEVAAKVGLTVGSLHQLYSDDYEALRQISIDKFGFTGTDL
jgi:RNA polymerase sigma factor (sigma-70 family)